MGRESSRGQEGNHTVRRGKMKSKGSVKKRIRLTATGKLKRHRAFHSHILTKKNAKRKRKLDTATLVDPVDQRRIRRLLA